MYNYIYILYVIDEYVAVPLVPIMEEHEDAMESSIFHELLKICGLYPPSNEQVCVLAVHCLNTPRNDKVTFE